MLYHKKRVWISWEIQRRSIELSKVLGCSTYIFEYNGFLRYPKSFLKVFLILFNEKPQILFVQNPSMILAALACIIGKIVPISIVVDRHTTFLLSNPKMPFLKRWSFLAMHRFTIKNATLTIVTNEYLAEIVKDLNGTSFVLPDPLPAILPQNRPDTKGIWKFLIPSSYGNDEPIINLLEAAKELQKDDVTFYFTGNYKKYNGDLKNMISPNIVLTGFLSEKEYFDLLFAVDGVIVLTKSSYCMLCGCYEAVSAEKPLITSNQSVLMEYFSKAIFIDNSSAEIARAVKTIISDVDTYKNRIMSLKRQLTESWEEKRRNLEIKLNLLKR
jgi:glycosyltransferase involved in cell wall biosynthesis